MEFKEIFQKYEALVAEVDKTFNKISEQTEEGINCAKGCSECCHALFDLTLVEAIYINRKFNEKYSGMERSTIMQEADKADRLIHKVKRRAFKASQSGASTAEILKEVSMSRVKCPFLKESNLCALYDFRPLTCRIYGVPMNIGGQAHSCQKSGFTPGKAYPTINMDTLQSKLMQLSEELAASINSSLKELPGVLVPLSMALLTDYTPEYLGANTGDKVEETPAPAAESSETCGTCDKDKSACASCNYSVELGAVTK
ncbi:YkgJ family cysteine cluster protein [Maridesulfovibrio sp.]|uniref:YkgJ family cysteine cluster protein n=1 Tax=Maridesulfovibrio sp. TaxID=2795000 RepID=UPI0029F4DC0B|nr:YkgJ family cysteine cluster protein [Maridesulfovibrio sp.]